MRLRQIAIPDAGSDFDRAVKERLEKAHPVKFPVYTAQELNSITDNTPYTDMMVVCSNGDNGNRCLAYCDGKKWIVVELASWGYKMVNGVSTVDVRKVSQS